MKRVFHQVKKIIPKISDTELIALRSGTTCIDKDIFLGKVDTKKIIKTTSEKKFDNSKIDLLLEKYGSIDKVYPGEKK